MGAAAHNHAFDGSDITVVPAPGQGDMALTDNQVIGGIEIDPAEVGNEDGDPGMGCV